MLPIWTSLVYFHLVTAKLAIGPILLSYIAAPSPKYTPAEKVDDLALEYYGWIMMDDLA